MIDSKLDEFIWSQKYRPQTIDETILPKKIKETFLSFKEKGNIPNMIFAGSSGIGKTTVAKAFCRELGIDYLFLNGSGEDRGIDTVKNKIARFATTVSFDSADKRKMIIYDEADNITADSQLALRSFIESNSDNCGFILTCNYPGRFIDPLLSRFHLMEFKIPKEERSELAIVLIKRIVEILKKENVQIQSLDAIKKLVTKYFPDIRKILDSLQTYAANGVIDDGIIDYIKKTDLSDLIHSLKEKEWTQMRKWVAENVEDHLDIVSDLYKKGNDYFKIETFPQAIIYLNEIQMQHPLAADKELNLVAGLTKIMSDCEFN